MNQKEKNYPKSKGLISTFLALLIAVTSGIFPSGNVADAVAADSVTIGQKTIAQTAAKTDYFGTTSVFTGTSTSANELVINLSTETLSKSANVEEWTIDPTVQIPTKPTGGAVYRNLTLSDYNNDLMRINGNHATLQTEIRNHLNNSIILVDFTNAGGTNVNLFGNNFKIDGTKITIPTPPIQRDKVYILTVLDNGFVGQGESQTPFSIDTKTNSIVVQKEDDTVVESTEVVNKAETLKIRFRNMDGDTLIYHKGVGNEFDLKKGETDATKIKNFLENIFTTSTGTQSGITLNLKDGGVLMPLPADITANIKIKDASTDPNNFDKIITIDKAFFEKYPNIASMVINEAQFSTNIKTKALTATPRIVNFDIKPVFMEVTAQTYDAFDLYKAADKKGPVPDKNNSRTINFENKFFRTTPIIFNFTDGTTNATPKVIKSVNGKEFQDIAIATEDGVSIGIASYFDIDAIANFSTGASSIKITPKQNLKLGGKYTIKIPTEHLQVEATAGNFANIGTDEFIINFTVEAEPTASLVKNSGEEIQIQFNRFLNFETAEAFKDSDIKIAYEKDSFGALSIANAKFLKELTAPGGKLENSTFFYEKAKNILTISNLGTFAPQQPLAIFVNSTTQAATQIKVKEPGSEGLAVKPANFNFTVGGKAQVVSQNVIAKGFTATGIADVTIDKNDASKAYKYVTSTTNLDVIYTTGMIFKLDNLSDIQAGYGTPANSRAIVLNKVDSVNNTKTPVPAGLSYKKDMNGTIIGVTIDPTDNLDKEATYVLEVDPSKFFTLDGKSAGTVKENYYFTIEPEVKAAVTIKQLSKGVENQSSSFINIKANLPIEFKKDAKGTFTNFTVVKSDGTGTPIKVKNIELDSVATGTGSGGYIYKVYLDIKDVGVSDVGEYKFNYEPEDIFRAKAKPDDPTEKVTLDPNLFEIIKDIARYNVTFKFDSFPDPQIDEFKMDTELGNIAPQQNTETPEPRATDKAVGVYVDTDITITFSELVKFKPGNTANNLIDIKEKNDGLLGSINDLFNVEYHFVGLDSVNNAFVDNVIADPEAEGFNQIVLKNKNNIPPYNNDITKVRFEPDKSYRFIIKNEVITDVTQNPYGNILFVADLETEKTPQVTAAYNNTTRNYEIKSTRWLDTLATKDLHLRKIDEYGNWSTVDLTNYQIVPKNESERVYLLKGLEPATYKLSILGPEKGGNVKRKTTARAAEHTQSQKPEPKETPLIAPSWSENPDGVTVEERFVSSYIELTRYTDTNPNALTKIFRDKRDGSGDNTEINLNTKIHVGYTNAYTTKETEINEAFKLNQLTADGTPGAGVKFASWSVIPSTGKIEGIDLTLEKPLLANTYYKLTITKNKFWDGNQLVAKEGIEEYIFKTEGITDLESMEPKEIEQTPRNQALVLTFNKPIDVIDAKKITIDGKTAFSDVSKDGRVLTLSINSTLAPKLSEGNHNVVIADGALKRAGDNGLAIPGFSQEFKVVLDPAEKAKKEAEEAAKKQKEEEEKRLKEEEEARKKAEEERKKAELEAVKKAIAEALAEEIQKRYRAEYGSSYNIDGNEAEYNKLLDELRKNGYVDDYLKKYGTKLDFAPDYINRYGGFAFFDKAIDENPFFKDPFTSKPNKDGYYDFYNFYDYGYKYPELRQGEDIISQETLELRQQLESKERELLAMQNQLNNQGYVNVSGYTAPVGIANRRILIPVGTNYATMYDEYGNQRNINLGTTSIISNGRTMLPVSELAKNMGVFVEYDSATKNTTLTKPGTTVVFNPKTSYVYINGVAENMGIRPMVQNGKTLIPIHYMAKAFGLENGRDVIFDSVSKAVTIVNY